MQKEDLQNLKKQVLSLKNKVEELTKKLMIDSLTGAFNRRYLNEVEKDKWHNKVCFVYFVDSNKLKQINDECGHKLGDKHLVEMANYLKSFGTVIRYGGDEFLVLSNKDMPSLVSTPDFSVGKFIKEKDISLEFAIDCADKQMYQNKAFFKCRKKS